MVCGNTKIWARPASGVKEMSQVGHTHDASQITSGVLPATRGGTGVTSMDALKSALGVPTGGSSQYDICPVGTLVKFDDKFWLCCHCDESAKLLYLISNSIISLTQFGSNNVYTGSTLASVAAQYQINNMSANALSYIANTTVNGVTAKVFVPSYEQMNGGFSYFNGNSNRIAYYNGSVEVYWTSSPNGLAGVWRVDRSGGLGGDGPNPAYGFRPCVALKL